MVAWIESLRPRYEYLTKLTTNVPDSIQLSGSVINCLDNILYNLLSNAEKHSGQPNQQVCSSICVDINYKIPFEYIFFVSNTISQYISEDEIKENINCIYTVLDNKAQIEEYHSMEGKSGYKKIVRLLQRKFNEDWDIGVRFEAENKTFNVELKIKIKDGN